MLDMEMSKCEKSVSTERLQFLQSFIDRDIDRYQQCMPSVVPQVVLTISDWEAFKAFLAGDGPIDGFTYSVTAPKVGVMI